MKYKHCCGSPKVIQNQVAISLSEKAKETLDSLREISALQDSPEHPILKNCQIGIPYENISDPKVLEVQKIARQIRGNVKHVNAGGCGLFACLLQELVGGEIYEICLLIKLNNQFVFHHSHLFLLHNGYCYDADGVCSESTLISAKQPLRRANSLDQIQETKPVETYCLFKRTKIEIQRKYEAGENMRIYFKENDAMELKDNASLVRKKMVA